MSLVLRQQGFCPNSWEAKGQGVACPSINKQSCCKHVHKARAFRHMCFNFDMTYVSRCAYPGAPLPPGQICPRMRIRLHNVSNQVGSTAEPLHQTHVIRETHHGTPDNWYLLFPAKVATNNESWCPHWNGELMVVCH